MRLTSAAGQGDATQAHPVKMGAGAWARVAGLTFLLHAVVEISGDYPTIIARGAETFTETARYVVEHTQLWRTALLAIALAWIMVVVLAFALYVVLEPVDKRLAQLALFLRLGGAFVGGASLMLRVAKTGIQLSTTSPTFSTEQLTRLAAVTQQGVNAGIYTSWMFMGLGSTLFFLLFLRSGYMPRALARYGVFTSMLLAVVAMVSFVFPQYAGSLKALLLLSLLSDLATGVWLLTSRR